jgi:hypothetical protein
MPPKPATGDGQLETGRVLRRVAAFLEQEGPVDFLNMDAAVLDGLGGVGDLQQCARGGFRIGERAGGGVFHAAALSYRHRGPRS